MVTIMRNIKKLHFIGKILNHDCYYDIKTNQFWFNFKCFNQGLTGKGFCEFIKNSVYKEQVKIRKRKGIKS